jgi:dTDP-4-amino-4,6-dideoxygalactose transaminase
MINVTRPFLPPKDEYLAILDDIWERNWLTNNGPVLNDLEQQLREYLQCENLWLVGNGTVAIQLAIKALELKGSILTTPFSYVATTSSIVWEGLKPVFVDISPDDFNVDPNLLEAAITPDTSAILLTHVFGNPCAIDQIQDIADRHGLVVIYDAAHCFGTRYDGRSVFSYGDMATTSFHATKLYSMVEGGAIFSRDAAVHRRVEVMRNFGHDGPETFAGVGINGKNSEFHAAMANFRHLPDILSRRKEQWLQYLHRLEGVDRFSFITIREKTDFNYSYFPVLFPSEEELLAMIKYLNGHYIYPRRYFYPSLNTLNYVEGQPCPVSEDVSQRILTLPLYHDLKSSTIDMICQLIIKKTF